MKEKEIIEFNKTEHNYCINCGWDGMAALLNFKWGYFRCPVCMCTVFEVFTGKNTCWKEMMSKNKNEKVL